jgi:hypothetical protein
MSKASKQEPDDDLLAEYDFSSISGAIRGKYYRRYRAGVNLALLEPEVAKAFPADTAVNEALRKALKTTKTPRRRPKLTRSAKAKGRGARS